MMEDTASLARPLKSLGVDVLDCSSGGMSPGSRTAGQTGLALGYQVPYAARLRQEAGIFTMALGLIVGAQQAEAILRQGNADLIAIGREMLRDPFWAAHAAEEPQVDPGFSLLPPQYGWWLNRRSKAGLAEALAAARRA
jgi:2,4-dienoyl-CoA reductase-like NADH-dependent reductase (Old Yellow Enzyme family)